MGPDAWLLRVSHWNRLRDLVQPARHEKLAAQDKRHRILRKRLVCFVRDLELLADTLGSLRLSQLGWLGQSGRRDGVVSLLDLLDHARVIWDQLVVVLPDALQVGEVLAPSA